MVSKGKQPRYNGRAVARCVGGLIRVETIHGARLGELLAMAFRYAEWFPRHDPPGELTVTNSEVE